MIDSVLGRMIKVGDLTLHLPGGQTKRAGDGTGAPVEARVNARGLRRIATNPSLGFGEAYMDGDLELLQGTCWDLLEIVGKSGARTPRAVAVSSSATSKAVRRKLQQVNGRIASRRNVAHHYDISNDLYRRFLDADMQYSCAYFERPGHDAGGGPGRQEGAHRRQALAPAGDHVLDIGSGWGGMAMTLAKDHGADVTGVTLSTEQLELARERAAAAGPRRQGPLRAHRLPRRDPPVRPHRLGRHVGARRRAQLRRLLRDREAAAQGRRRRR